MNYLSVHERRFLAGVALALVPGMAAAAEGYRLRASLTGGLGAEMGIPLQAPGFYGNVTVSHTEVTGVAGSDGNQLTTAAREVPLLTATPTAGAIPNGAFRLVVPAGTVNLKQSQTQLNLIGTYLPAAEFAGGRFVLRANLPVVRVDRDFSVTMGASTISPQPSSPPLPPAALSAVNAVAAATNTQVQAALAASSAMQNDGVSGLGDLELSAAWVSSAARFRWAAIAGLYLPTGTYNPNRGPNPGFGDFRTFQLGVASVYALDEGLQLGGRASWATNSTNRKTGYRSGDFALFEAALRKDWMRWGVGINAVAVRQLEDDRTGGAATNGRLRNYAAGPLVTWRLSRDITLTAQHSRTFGERNAQVSHTTLLRMDVAMH